MSEMPPRVLFDSFGGGFASSWRFAAHQATLVAVTAAEVLPVLKAAAEATAAGSYAVGFIAYEAAAALNPDLPALPPCPELPLVWFAVFGNGWPLRPARTPQVLPSGAGTRS
jgi:para-aminobenzoate synthetase/4-amino-4-deoxychorismate lyase